GLRSASPKVLEPVWRHFGVPDRVLNVLVPEVVLQGSRVVAIVGELEPTGMAQHVGVDRKWHLGSLPDALHKPVEANRTDWSAALGNRADRRPGSLSRRDGRSDHTCEHSPSAARPRAR